MKTRTHAERNARAQMASILRLMHRIDAGDETSQEEAYEMPLSVLIRSGWHPPGGPSEPEEYEILLSTGGPACRIIGDLQRNEPATARLQHQDWFKPWEHVALSQMAEDTLLRFASLFFFGE